MRTATRPRRPWRSSPPPQPSRKQCPPTVSTCALTVIGRSSTRAPLLADLLAGAVGRRIGGAGVPPGFTRRSPGPWRLRRWMSPIAHHRWSRCVVGRVFCQSAPADAPGGSARTSQLGSALSTPGPAGGWWNCAGAGAGGGLATGRGASLTLVPRTVSIAQLPQTSYPDWLRVRPRGSAPYTISTGGPAVFTPYPHACPVRSECG